MPTILPTPPAATSACRLVPAMLAALGLLTLPGCATNPLVAWERPALKASPAALDEAQRYADAARTAYQEARGKQVSATTGLNSALLGLGVLGTGFAVAKMHRDVLLGTAMLGGAAYAFGQQNVNVQHRLVYEAGIDAIGCAKEVVQPLAMSASDRTELEAAMKALDEQVLTTSSARADASAALAAWTGKGPADNEASANAQAAIASAGSAIDAAISSVSSGRVLIKRAGEAGDKLVATVERVDAAVNKAVAATLPDPASVFKAISGLPGFAAGIVPGSDAAINAALAKSSAALKPVAPQAGLLSASKAQIFDEGLRLFNAVVALNKATDALKLTLARVNGRLPTEESISGLLALKDCNLGDVSFALKAQPAAPSITAGGERRTSFSLSGGTAPYVVQLQVSPIKGVSLVAPAPFDRTVGFEITKDAEPGTVPVTVMDASKPGKSLVVVVEILPATKSAAGDQPGAAPAPDAGRLAPANASALAKAINDKAVFAHKSGVELSVSHPAVRKSDAQVDLGLSCKPAKPTKCISAADARLTVLAALSAPANMGSVLNISPAQGCICAP